MQIRDQWRVAGGCVFLAFRVFLGRVPCLRSASAPSLLRSSVAGQCARQCQSSAGLLSLHAPCAMVCATARGIGYSWDASSFPRNTLERLGATSASQLPGTREIAQRPARSAREASVVPPRPAGPHVSAVVSCARRWEGHAVRAATDATETFRDRYPNTDPEGQQGLGRGLPRSTPWSFGRPWARLGLGCEFQTARVQAGTRDTAQNTATHAWTTRMSPVPMHLSRVICHEKLIPADVPGVWCVAC